VLEGEVQADADEGGAEDDGDNLELEGGAVPGVEAEEGAADVAWAVLGRAIELGGQWYVPAHSSTHPDATAIENPHVRFHTPKTIVMTAARPKPMARKMFRP
jgi:hypothetical protein